MAKDKDAFKPQPAPAATPDATAAAAHEAEMRPSAAPAVPPAPVPQAEPPVRSLDDVDWKTLDAPVAVPRKVDPSTLVVTMGHDFVGNILVATMAAWKAKAKFDTLDYASCRPKNELGVLIMTPCQKGEEGWTQVSPDGNAAHVNLRVALQDFEMTWPKDQNISFPTLVRETARGWSLILNVAGKKYTPIRHRIDKSKKGKETKP